MSPKFPAYSAILVVYDSYSFFFFFLVFVFTQKKLAGRDTHMQEEICRWGGS